MVCFTKGAAKMIRKVGDKYVVLSHDGKKKLGEYPTKPQAEERLKQVEMFKHIKKNIKK